MRVLVAGGTGYIGSHTVVSLIQNGHDVVIADMFSNSKQSVVRRLEQLAKRRIPCVELDVTEEAATRDLFARNHFDAVIQSAGYKAVGESVRRALDYYGNNLRSTMSLLDAMVAHDVRRLVFSSSATVYGEAPVPYSEDHRPLASSHPYGRTKVIQEQILEDVAEPSGIKVAVLRYFNPVGAHPSGLIGEDPQGVPDNLMPAIAQVAVGRLREMAIFGDDYDTPDGTCQRDYIHVDDLARGHVAALEHLDAQPDSLRAFNLGAGVGISVKEVIRAFEDASGIRIPVKIAPRREGDLPASWANTERAQRELGWSAQKPIQDACADMWRWQQRNPLGYKN